MQNAVVNALDTRQTYYRVRLRKIFVLDKFANIMNVWTPQKLKLTPLSCQLFITPPKNNKRRLINIGNLYHLQRNYLHYNIF